MRINELATVVDYFVIVESAMTFTGQRKELYFRHTAHLLQKFSEQIIHIVLHKLDGHHTWEKETFHRRQVFAVGLHQIGKEVQPGDIVILSDLDEIPKPQVLMALKACSGYPSSMALECPGVYYSFGLLVEGSSWVRAKVSVWKEDLDADATRIRREEHIISTGCWHCSYCFPRTADFIHKIESFSHVEYDRLPFKDPTHIVVNTRDGLDMFDRDIVLTQATEVDAPSYVKVTPEFSYMLNRSGTSAGYKDYLSYFTT